jgi:Uma2 family endonuclease
MTTVALDEGQVHIPNWVVDLQSFRRWADSDEFPQTGRIGYLKGEVWVDMSKEQVFTHVDLKGEFTEVLRRVVKAERLGRYFPDGLLLVNVLADIAWKPDGTFISMETLRSGRVQLVAGKKQGYVELEGPPDMVLEVVSDSSVHKDTVALREAYAEVGIREYWLVDARREPLRFDILRLTPKGYVATRKQGGWLKSAVFGKSFQLTQQTDPLGYPEYTLAVR